MPRPTFSPVVQCFLGILFLFAFSGCSESVQFSVLRAPRVSVASIAKGNEPTVAMGTWSGSSTEAQGVAADIASRVRDKLVNAESTSLKLVQSGGAATLNGTVNEFSKREDVSAAQQTCSKYENKKEIKYQCTKHTRTGHVRLRVTMEVVGSDGKVAGSQMASTGADPTTEDTDKDAPPIAWDTTLSQLREGAATVLAAAIVPFRVTVSKPWFSCGDANDTCKLGLGHLRASRFDDADTTFQQAVAKLIALPKPDPKALAAAYWGLTLAREFNGHFAEAREALAKAREQNPEEEAFADESSSIATEEANAKKLTSEAGGSGAAKGP